jgi:hypothetical protein
MASPNYQKYRENATKAYQTEYRYSCEGDSSCSYPNISASEINSFLRTEMINDKGVSLFPYIEENKTFIKYIMQVVHGIDERMVPNTDDITTFYRGISWSVYKQMAANNLLINKSYTSSTRNLEVAYSFTEKSKDPSKNIILQFNIPININIYDFGDSHEENEVLIQRNTQFISPAQKETKIDTKYRIIPVVLLPYTIPLPNKISTRLEYPSVEYSKQYPTVFETMKKTNPDKTVLIWDLTLSKPKNKDS